MVRLTTDLAHARQGRWSHLVQRVARVPVGRSRSVRGRFVGSVALLTAIGLAGAGFAAFYVERRNIDARIDDALSQEILEFRELAERGFDPETGKPFKNPERLMTLALERNVTNANEALIGFLPTTTVVSAGHHDDLHTDPDFRAKIVATTAPAYGEYRTVQDEFVRFAVMPVVFSGVEGHYVVAFFVDREVGEFGYAIRTYAIAALATLLGVCAVAWSVASRVIRPVRDVRDAAAAITGSDLSRRIEIRGDDEVAALAETFNDMLDRIETAWTAQRQMLDDAGHELRTPITIVRGHLEVLDPRDPSDVIDTRILVLDELNRMKLIVEDLLVLANSKRPDFLKPVPLPVRDFLAGVLEKAQGLGERQWVLDAGPDFYFCADPRRLSQALLQLAANACAVTQPGQTVALGASANGPTARIWVRDQGPGVPPEDRRRIFERFNRGSHPVGEGSGLGLSIVEAIAQAHGGRTYVRAAEPAGGARFVIELPRSIGEGGAVPVDRHRGPLG